MNNSRKHKFNFNIDETLIKNVQGMLILIILHLS